MTCRKGHTGRCFCRPLWNRETARMTCGAGAAVVYYNHRMQNGVSSSFITALDGLRLHASATPVVCLPGLARTAADFEALASALSHEKPIRRVIALDYRGRGQSQYDRNPANYALPVELADVLAVVTALDVTPAIFVGTSRSGILTMLLAAVR